MNITIYHHNDEDGWASAACVLKKYPQAICVSLERYSYVHLVEDQDIVFLLDFCFKQEEMDFLEKNNKEFIWIDHHQSAINQLKKHYKGIREEGKAGCELIWSYLYPTTPMPKVIHYIGRYDVWDLTDEIRSFILYLQINLIPFKQPFQIRDMIDQLTETDYQEKIYIGKQLLLYQHKQLEKQNKRGIVGEFLGYKAGIYFSNANISELGNYVLEKNPHIDLFVAIMILINEEGKPFYKYSLRSTEGRVDVAKLSETQGGGGHPYAAGFESTKILWNIS
jgi:oligoribonuclease NrnB/cAMP/cGMP phosphodiesterase (DHH superfamily)